MFNYDWFHGTSYQQQAEEATWRCVRNRFPDVARELCDQHEEAVRFRSELETRTLLYLRDGFSYELKQIAEVTSKSHLVFECEPVDDQYKTGAFVVTVPFDEIVRVEMFAVHPDDKPADNTQITGFRSYQEPFDHKLGESKPPKPGR